MAQRARRQSRATADSVAHRELVDVKAEWSRPARFWNYLQSVSSRPVGPGSAVWRASSVYSSIGVVVWRDDLRNSNQEHRRSSSHFALWDLAHVPRVL